MLYIRKSTQREEARAVPEWMEVVECDGMELSSRVGHGVIPGPGKASYHNPDVPVNKGSTKVICWDVFRLHFAIRAISKPLIHLLCDTKGTFLEADRLITCREVFYSYLLEFCMHVLSLLLLFLQWW